MIEWLEAYIKSLVSKPDAVEVSPKKGEVSMVLNISVAKEDLDLLQGRHNRLVRALNVVASLAGVRSRTRYILKVCE